MCMGKVHDTPAVRNGQEEAAAIVGVRPIDFERGAERTRVAPERSEASTAATAGASAPYLESKGNSVIADDDEVVGFASRYEVKAVGCKCRFCDKCSMSLGLKLKAKLIPVLKTFQRVMMLTLTIDPKLFDSPEAAYWHVRDERAIARLVKALCQAGHLRSRRFFYVVEWHKNGWPHFHLLVETDKIPHKELARLWGRHRPKSAPAWEGNYNGSLKGQSPEFGSIRFTKSKFNDGEHAAHYACKYLLKPKEEFPEWVLDSKRQIKIFSTSHRLFPSQPRPPKAQHPSTCFCDECRGEPLEAKPKKARTIRERLEDCGTQAALLRVMYFTKASGKVVRSKEPKFVCIMPTSFQQTLALIDVDSEGLRRAVINDEEDLKRFKPLLHPRVVATLWPEQGPQLVRRERRSLLCA